jgi:hypothetical protein
MLRDKAGEVNKGHLLQESVDYVKIKVSLKTMNIYAQGLIKAS